MNHIYDLQDIPKEIEEAIASSPLPVLIGSCAIKANVMESLPGPSLASKA
jgi:hypothetical protein